MFIKALYSVYKRSIMKRYNHQIHESYISTQRSWPSNVLELGKAFEYSLNKIQINTSTLR